MTSTMAKRQVNSEDNRGLGQPSPGRRPSAAVEVLTKAVEESGEDQSPTIAVVTPRGTYYVYSITRRAIQETNSSASGDLVC